MVKLWAHQQTALQLMKANPKYFGLFMDMSTGKSLTALTFIHEQDYQKILVLGTTSSLDVWSDELKKYGFDWDIVDFRGLSSIERVYLLKSVNVTKPTLYLINYEALAKKQFATRLMVYQFDIIVADEAHKLKSHNAISSKVAAMIPAKYRLAMTGTPDENNLLDIFGIARFLAPEMKQSGKKKTLCSHHFGTWTHFKERYATWYNTYIRLTYQNLDELAKIRDSFSYTVRVEDTRDLPPEQHIIHRVKLEPAIKKLYRQFEKDFIIYVQDQAVLVQNKLGLLIRLQEMVGGSIKLKDGTYTPISTAKVERLREILEEIGSNKVVIFHRFTQDRLQITNLLKSMKLQWLEINGETKQYQEWKDNKANIIVVQMSAGSEGIDLADAHYTVYYSLEWSASKFRQSKMRTQRTTQKHDNVIYHYLLAEHTVDEDIYKSLIEKNNDVKVLFGYITSRYEKNGD